MNEASGYPNTGSTDPFGINIGQNGYYGFVKMGDLTFPGPSGVFVIIDENLDTLNDAQYWAIATANPTTLCDMPAPYHAGATGFAFADGHSEIHKWSGELNSAYWENVLFYDRRSAWQNPYSGGDKTDLNWITNRLADPRRASP